MVKIGGATLEEVSPYFHLPIEAAARELGVCSSALKRRCRRLGIKRWPFRKVRSMSMSMARNMEDLCGAGAGGVMPSFLQPQAASRLAAHVAASSLAQRKKNTGPVPCPQVSQLDYDGGQTGDTGSGRLMKANPLQSASFSTLLGVAEENFQEEANGMRPSIQKADVSNQEGVSWDNQNIKPEKVDFRSPSPAKVPPKPRTVRPSVPLQRLSCPPPLFPSISAVPSFDVSLVDIPSFFSPAAGRLLPGKENTPKSRLAFSSPGSPSYRTFSNSLASPRQMGQAQHFNHFHSTKNFSPKVLLSPRVFGEELVNRGFNSQISQEEMTVEQLTSPRTQSRDCAFGLLNTPKGTECGYSMMSPFEHMQDERLEIEGHSDWSILDPLTLDLPLLSPASRDLLAASPLPSPPRLCNLDIDPSEQFQLPSFTDLLSFEWDALPPQVPDPMFELQPNSRVLRNVSQSQQGPQSPFSWLKIATANERDEKSEAEDLDPYYSLLLSPGPWQWRTSHPSETEISNALNILDPSTRNLFL